MTIPRKLKNKIARMIELKRPKYSTVLTNKKAENIKAKVNKTPLIRMFL
jgi:hypothetical protein